ncbi:lachesin [Caerostris extrusa]|uniref:Lachesin n=1 Tax=Caerostris extrusa TaxID=172846 RepID=A0AAV4NJA6_CAEEX|nr:lachesin [Caerostris extrusa]
MLTLCLFFLVTVPPRISENVTSSDTDVREGSDVSLRCDASGSPPPHIKWRREDEKDITIGLKKVPTVEGQFLNITKTSRLHMSAYLCIASNGIPLQSARESCSTSIVRSICVSLLVLSCSLNYHIHKNYYIKNFKKLN